MSQERAKARPNGGRRLELGVRMPLVQNFYNEASKNSRRSGFADNLRGQRGMDTSSNIFRDP